MSDQKIFARYKANELRSELQILDMRKAKQNIVKRKGALKKVIANLTLGNYAEMIMLFSEILKYWRIEDDIEVKRICHEYVRAVGTVKPRSTIDALPCILEDLRTGNDEVQILALTTLVTVPFSKFTEAAFNFIMTLVNRRSTSMELQRNAITALVQLDDWSHEKVMSLMLPLRDIFEQKLDEPAIQIAALSTLYAIHEKNLNLKPFNISVNTAFDLLDTIPRLSEWDISSLLEVLPVSVVPQRHGEAYEMIDIALEQLQNVNTSVALNALRFIVYLFNYIETVDENITTKLSNCIVALLDKSPEIEFLILRNVILLLLSRDQSLLNLDVSYFFIEYRDPIYIKDTKLECLYLLANKGNLIQILDELEQYSTDIDIQMSRKAIRAIGNLAVKLGTESAKMCMDILIHLLQFGVDYVIEEIISVSRNILRKYPDDFRSTVNELVNYIDNIQEAESKNAMIWIISQFSDHLPNYLELFDTFCYNITDETLEVQYTLLNSSVKFFIRNPTPLAEKICMKVLKAFTEDVNNPDLRSRAFLYWRLLSATSDPSNNITIETLSEIIDGELPLIELNTKLDPLILEELELNIGTITSLYLKPNSQIFRANRIKCLEQSPILNKTKQDLKVIKGTKPSGHSGRASRQHNKSGGSTPQQTMPTINDYDKPAEKVNHLKGTRKSSISSPSKLSRKPSMLMRKLSLKKKF
ncbi:hypothetical protein KAFR_0C06290 [Kazachstania africana CBS 2517]|uniref:AP complex subunit beta n=1 Tax=Kazachstania africana (strain ATCC 22294 / BCRC 22015 / CBS 2517 / CECT 1963 / NBRC 1671 / NRRL Y-8276) TaxID=1071382 RepID=H2ATC5_KAZAF|nr:hypothetical protein KAFR_0C06290 [Kazachstania africana CBS 2517]CCF57625.1 hypothetical protein KAFR_0C06290 [Kazachstania africana CBS 2517]